ncbi:DUF2158 domain-containing protein [Phreatobacter aquaticus]|uniref:DUF2158 domain-containing protein n=1 Tax=Phreatobacter aquaticus TaxID=2570229 RepID=A0A4D7QS93_9HYPH|nr:DUF2158 domain-containing protein [Phreatobacter aquaticus]QCK88319.1 DUF2158 domain-containing protein [Phreatobacter aquaticus]
MSFEAGDVVMLKSGGQPMTIASIDADEALCLWMGEEGDLFRERLPSLALIAIIDDEEGPEEAEEDEDGEEDEDEHHEQQRSHG